MTPRFRIAALLAGALVCASTAFALAAKSDVTAEQARIGAATSNVVLRAVVLLDKPGEVQKAGLSAAAAHGVDASRLPGFAGAAADPDLTKLLGKPASLKLVGEVRAALQKYAQTSNHPFAAVTIPPQDISSGVLQVVVVEGKLGKVSVEGADWFSAGEYERAVRLKPGQPINNADLSADTDWLNQSQYRHVVIVAQPGAQFGTTDLVVRAQDRRPITFNAGFDDTGTKSTSLYRMSTGFDWGDAFWRGDDLNYEFTAAPDPGRLSQHSLSYTFNLPWHDSLSLSGSYATTNSLPSGITNTTGITGTASPRYNMLLPTVWGIRQTLSLGYDFKTTNNNILFGGVSVFPSTSEVDQFSATYSGGLADPFGSTNATLLIVGSPGGMTPLNNNTAFQSQQAGAVANYVYARVTLDRLTELPQGFSWQSRLTGQLSSAILLPSEQLVFGGFQSIRGFVEQGVTRDEGVTWQNELRLPTLEAGTARLLHLDPESDALVPFWFFDIGGGRNHQELPGAPTSWVSLASTGPGVTWNVARNLSFRFTWGIPLMRVGAFIPRLGPQAALQLTF
ncbi:MAG TPA: ShlB/FhaC/HecB family hemolysin secretion/activation protein [Stellaceae bacterium]|nr:ShlB/FhaC/HecB family hemolysin secretion/activation protein [Stellaceae bacterium]